MKTYVNSITAPQLSGRADFSRTLYWFHFIAPLGFVTFAACLLWERVRHKRSAADRENAPPATHNPLVHLGI